MLAGAVQGVDAQTPLPRPQGDTPAPDRRLWLPPFQYIQGAQQFDPERAATQRPAGQQKVVELYQAGRYAEAAQAGMALLASEKVDDELRLMIANSMAWTGKLEAARTVYQGVTDPALVADANVGIASLLRWQDKDHLAAPIYRSVLEQAPEHKEALAGLALAERELAPRTSITYGGLQDSNQFERRAGTVNHRWRGNEGWDKYEVELSALNDALPDIEKRQQEATLRYQALDVRYKPALEASVPSTGSIFLGGMKLLFDEDRVRLDVGRVNWGRLANNAHALDQGLRATHAGLLARRDTPWGAAVGLIDYYSISDGNTIWTGNARLMSNWQPLGSHVRPFVGVEARQASFLSSRYWSPSEGYGSLYGGLQFSRSVGDWSLEASGQLGVPLYGEAGNSWGASAGARRWLTQNLALGGNLRAMSSKRADSEYKAQSFDLTLEKVWR